MIQYGYDNPQGVGKRGKKSEKCDPNISMSKQAQNVTDEGSGLGIFGARWEPAWEFFTTLHGNDRVCAQ